MRIPPPVQGIIERLHAESFQAYLTGGCVRDMLLHREPKDWDVATDAQPGDLIRLFHGANQVGAHFGVILWDGVEIATFRSDGPYSDGRRPESVNFETNPANDASRRDFTINGLFYDTRARHVLDFVHGQQDLAAGIIRAIGDPAKRFAEDHLRLLRAVRFAARFGFEIEPETAAAIRTWSHEITKVAPERTRDELTKILTEGHPRRGFELLSELGLLEYLLPEVKAMQGVAQPAQFHPEGDVWTHTMRMLDDLREPSITLAWGVLLHDVGKPPTYTFTDRIRFNGHAERGAAMSETILRRLHYPSFVIDRVYDLVANHMRFLAAPRMKLSTRKRFLRSENFAEWLELHRIDCANAARNFETYEFCKAELAATPPESLHPAPLVTGRDLLAAGVPEGPTIGRMLRQIEEAQLEGTLTTREAALALVLGDVSGDSAPTAPA